MTDIPQGYTRVTEVLGPWSDFDGIPPSVLANAADRGTRAHKFCELYMRNLLMQEVDEDCQGYFKSFLSWYHIVCDQVSDIELRVNCPELKVSGQLDMIATLKGDNEPMVIDIKTPQSAAKTWRLQTAAYLMLARRYVSADIKRRACLMLDKSGGPAKFKEYHDTRDEEMFLNAVELYQFFKK